jgi:tetratricopeptide (TPR) repeat protein/transcriptional regulator with XRE-family HTH domain
VAETADAPAGIGSLLRRLRRDAGLTQEELAEAAELSVRAVRDVERGAVATPQKETVRRLADALGLVGPVRAGFETTARGRAMPGGVAAATRTLPRDIASFTGRQVELQRLVGVAADAGGVVDIHAIDGMAGVGKTTFAVHVAHRLADRFPDGQIFLPLHGHTPGHEPVEPEDALASLLLAAGVSAGQVPSGLEARTALWRDRLAGLRMLLILDDAMSSEQVLPLLPGSGGSLVLVTSRRHLAALDDATVVSLDTLPAQEAALLLTRLAGRPGLSIHHPGVAEVARLCGYLPLAIGMVARQLRHHPAWTVAGRAAELAAAVDRLGLLATENVSVAAAFDLSYADLHPDQQRLFRRLGLHPGPEVDAFAAAALDGTRPAVARRGLEALYDQNLLTETAGGRYRMHDLLREHARALAARVDSFDERERAAARLLDYYQRTAARAEALITRRTRPGPAPVPGEVEAPALDDSERALEWVRTERAGLIACLDHAAGAGLPDRVVALTAGLAELLRRDGPWDEAGVRHQAAIDAARRLGDRLGEANALYDLGDVLLAAADFLGSTRVIDQALAIYRALGERLGEANALHLVGPVRRMMGDYPAAVAALESALGLYRDLGDRRGEANALLELGPTLFSMGEPSASAERLEAALAAFRAIGDRYGQASVLYYRGIVTHEASGQYSSAIESLELALELYRDVGFRTGEANAQYGLARVRRLMGDYGPAAEALEAAARIYRELGSINLTIALKETGYLHQATGNLGEAMDSFRQALDLARTAAYPALEADVLVGMGRCTLASGDTPQAVDLLRRALEIYRRIGATTGDDVARELSAITEREQAREESVAVPSEGT